MRIVDLLAISCLEMGLYLSCDSSDFSFPGKRQELELLLMQEAAKRAEAKIKIKVFIGFGFIVL